MLGLFPTAASALAATFSNGSSITSTQVAYGDASGKITSDSGFVRSSLVLTLDANTDNTFTSGYVRMGLVSGGTSTNFYLAQATCWNITDYALQQTPGGITVINAKSGQSVQLRTSNNARLTILNGSATFASGVPVTVSDTTASTTGATGCLILSGGCGSAGAFWSSLAPAAATSPAYGFTGTSTIVGGVTDAYTGAFRSTPTYSAGSALTVTRHNYIDLNQPTLSGAGPAALTDACVFRFDAAIGTHKAVDSGTTKTSPGTVTAWVKVNINGTVHYLPAYASKTT